MVEALQCTNFLVDQVQVCCMMQGDYAFFLAGTNDEIEVTLVPRDERVAASDGGVWPETGFVRSGSESTDSWITLEGTCGLQWAQDDGESVMEHD